MTTNSQRLFSLGTTVRCTDPAVALVGEEGVFTGIAPDGAEYRITAARGHSITGIHYVQGARPGTPRDSQDAWLLTKVAEPLTTPAVDRPLSA